MLQGDTVKDDSGSCAVFTEQGSSASQMTAAKVMDVIARLRMRRASSRRRTSIHQSQIGRCIVPIKKFQSFNVQTYGHVCHDTSGRNLNPSFLLNIFFGERRGLENQFHFKRKVSRTPHTWPTQTSRHSCPNSSSTTVVEGVPPSVPKPPRCSRSERPKDATSQLSAPPAEPCVSC